VGDLVETEVEPSQVNQFIEVLYLLDNVVVKLKFLEFFHTIKIVDDPDVLVR